MAIFTEIIGNVNDPEWHNRLYHSGPEADVETVTLDQWTAQKSRFLAVSDRGVEYPVALRRQSRIKDGDILAFDPDTRHTLVLRLALSPVLEVDLSGLASKKPEEIILRAVELGHAIGNQHWPAVVKGTKVYVPLTVDRKVMLSVMETHHLEDITYQFREADEVIPYMAPHEVRRLFGGASHESAAHVHDHDHIQY